MASAPPPLVKLTGALGESANEVNLLNNDCIVARGGLSSDLTSSAYTCTTLSTSLSFTAPMVCCWWSAAAHFPRKSLSSMPKCALNRFSALTCFRPEELPWLCGIGWSANTYSSLSLRRSNASSLSLENSRSKRFLFEYVKSSPVESCATCWKGSSSRSILKPSDSSDSSSVSLSASSDSSSDSATARAHSGVDILLAPPETSASSHPSGAFGDSNE